MSDNWIVLVSEDPQFVPDDTSRAIAQGRFAQMLPSERVNSTVNEAIQFVDCGANFESITCPSCQSDVPIEWWQHRMSEDFHEGFRLATFAMPCCGTSLTLNQLVYHLPQAFGRFVMEAMNPGTDRLGGDQKRELEEILGTNLTVIYRHL